MKILALETSTEYCSVALWQSCAAGQGSAAGLDGVTTQHFELVGQKHSELLIAMVAALLQETGFKIGDMDGIAYGSGPGSFTGVRIAIAVAQGIAFATGLPVAPISTLAAIAWETGRRQGVDRIAVALDARLEEVYWGTYRAAADGGVLLLGEERVCSPEQASLPEVGEWVGAGNGWALYADCLSRPALKTWWSDYGPTAEAVARLGALAYRQGRLVGAEQVLPVYLRDEVVKQRSC